MAHRPPRKPTRLSSPFVIPQPDGLHTAAVEPEKEQGISSDMTWQEPQPRASLPSFMDYRGLERVGVLEQMQALGSMPSAKMKAKARQDLSRRTAQGRSLGSYAEPEMASNSDELSATPNARAVSQIADEDIHTPRHVQDLYSLESPTPAEAIERAMASMPSMASMAPLARGALQAAQLLPELPAPRPVIPVTNSYLGLGTPRMNGLTIHAPAAFGSPAQPGSPYQRAIALAARNGDAQTEQLLYQIHLQAHRDPQLVDLLTSLTHPPETFEEQVALDRKIRAFKRKVHGESFSPDSSASTIIKSTIGHDENRPSQSPIVENLGAASIPATIMDPLIDPALTQTSTTTNIHSPQPPSSHPKIRLRHQNQIPVSSGTQSSTPSSPTKQSIEGAALQSRRSSSSSLSSIDDTLFPEQSVPAQE